MQSQLEQLLKIIPLLATLTALFYWTGRWYTEWYFNQFAVNYKSIQFDKTYYLHASWNTALTAICLGMIFTHVMLVIYIIPQWYWLAISLIMSLVSTIILTHWPYKFDPTYSFPKKILGAREFSLQITGWLSLGFTLLIVKQYPQQYSRMLSDLYTIIQHNFVTTIFLCVVSVWALFALVGYFLGRYHGQSAIWEGRMGVKWAKVASEWWLLVERTNDGRNLMYNRDKNISIFVKDDEISQMKPFTTKTNHKKQSTKV